MEFFTKKFFTEFNNFIPTYTIIFHMNLVIFYSSDCNKINHNFFSVLFHLICLSLFIFNTAYMSYSIPKSILIVLEYISFAYLRAKPFKCFGFWSMELALVYFWIIQIIVLIFIYKNKDTYTNEDTRLNEESESTEHV